MRERERHRGRERQREGESRERQREREAERERDWEIVTRGDRGKALEREVVRGREMIPERC